MDILYKQIIEIFLNSLHIELQIINKTTSSNYSKINFHSLCISNHISELDPIILYYLFSQNNMKYIFISDKKVKKIPIFGLLSSIENTIYIDRIDHIQSIKELNEQVHKDDFVCIFPEGTLFYQPMIEKSNEICKKLNIPIFQNVLCPKINGYNELIKILQPNMITDITLHYIYSKKSKYILKNSNSPLTILQLIKYPPKKIVIIIQEKSCFDTQLNSYINIMSVFRKKDKEMKLFSKSKI